MATPDPLPIRRSSAPILSQDQPWEAGAFFTAVAVFADQAAHQLLLYYAVRFRDRSLDNVLCLAQSDDGREWRKPDCGDGTNIVMRSAGRQNDWGMFSPNTILHEPEDPDSAQRWKMLYWDRPDAAMPSGYCLAVSADGRSWKPLHDRPVITGANDAGSLIGLWPGIRTPCHAGSHLILQQTLRHNPALPTERDNLKHLHRQISVWQCEQFTGRWTGPVQVLGPDAADAPDLQFYWLAPFKTPAGIYGGFLNCHHTLDQTMDVQLVSSRDGWSWTREHHRRPILPLGPVGRFDCGMVSVLAAPVPWADRWLVFYNGRATVHDGRPHRPDRPLPEPPNGIGVAEFAPGWLNLAPV